jgi:cyclomaltodextrinase
MAGYVTASKGATVEEPDWVQHAVWWQVYPLGFVGAEQDALPTGSPAVHRLPQLVSWLDYAVELGASGIALGPVFASETHGYDTSDYFHLDPRLGDEADFDELIREAHSRGLRVLLDGVFNHTGRSFPPFQEAVAQGPSGPKASWFRFNWPAAGWSPGLEPEYVDFEGHHHLVALNHAEPEVAGFVARVMKHWLGRGADGWRLDAAYAVPTSFWNRVLTEVRADFPDAYFVGEYIHGDYAAAVHDSGLDSATQYELWKAVWSSLNDRNFYELAAAMERHNSFLAGFAPLTFIGNHDVTRIASKLQDPALLPLAIVVLLTVGGTPSIYYGDEQAFQGIKEDRAGGDDAVRPVFPASPEDLDPAGWPLYRLHQELIGLRRRHAWLHSARTAVLKLSNEQLVFETENDGGSLTVALNLADEPADLEVPASTLSRLAKASLLSGAGSFDNRLGKIKLPARGWAILG